jgi:hypothetical protein
MWIFGQCKAALAWLGQQGTRALAAFVFIGIAIPFVGAVLKSFVTESVFVLLCIAFLRMDTIAFKHHVRKPTVVLAATAWTSIVVQLIFGLGSIAVGLPDGAPELRSFGIVGCKIVGKWPAISVFLRILTIKGPHPGTPPSPSSFCRVRVLLGGLNPSFFESGAFQEYPWPVTGAG